MNIRKTRHDDLAQYFDPFAARGQPGVGQMVNEIRAHEFIHDSVVRVVLEFLDEPADHFQIRLTSGFRF